MANLPVPPTYASPVVVNKATGEASFSPIWLNWFLQFAHILENAAAGTGVDHESLANLQGGAANQHYHFTSAEHTKLVAYDHESLAGLLGGAAADHYHLKATERTTVISGPAQAVTSITPPASTGHWQNTTGFNVLVIASGGTTVTYELSRDNITYYPVGTPTIIPVVRGDYLKVTYVGAPTLSYFAM